MTILQYTRSKSGDTGSVRIFCSNFDNTSLRIADNYCSLYEAKSYVVVVIWEGSELHVETVAI